MSPSKMLFRSSVVAAVLAGGVTLTLGWATDLRAVDPSAEIPAQAALAAADTEAPAPEALEPGQAVVGTLKLEIGLIPKAKNPKLMVAHIVATNPTGAKVTARVHVAVNKSEGGGFSRVEAAPEVVYQRTLKVALAPGETMTKELELPAGLSKKILARQAAMAKAEETGEWTPGPSYVLDSYREDEGPMELSYLPDPEEAAPAEPVPSPADEAPALGEPAEATAPVDPSKAIGAAASAVRGVPAPTQAALPVMPPGNKQIAMRL